LELLNNIILIIFEIREEGRRKEKQVGKSGCFTTLSPFSGGD
jgi:hypothetical protein